MTSFIVYDLETHTTDRTETYIMIFYRLSKIAGKYIRDLPPYEREKRKKDSFVFDSDNCTKNVLDFLIELKGEEDKFKKIFEYNLHFHAHGGSSFDTWIILSNLPCDKHFVDKLKKRKALPNQKSLMDILALTRKNKFSNAYILDVE